MGYGVTQEACSLARGDLPWQLKCCGPQWGPMSRTLVTPPTCTAREPGHRGCRGPPAAWTATARGSGRTVCRQWGPRRSASPGVCVACGGSVGCSLALSPAVHGAGPSGLRLGAGLPPDSGPLGFSSSKATEKASGAASTGASRGCRQGPGFCRDGGCSGLQGRLRARVCWRVGVRLVLSGQAPPAAERRPGRAVHALPHLPLPRGVSPRWAVSAARTGLARPGLHG